MKHEISACLRKSSLLAIGICLATQAQAQIQPIAFAEGSSVADEEQAPAEARPAAAEQAEAAVVRDDIVVTARRREERLQDVPISIVAMSGAQLEERGIISLADVQNAVPGIRVEAQQNRTTTPQITIRGQRQYGVLEAQDPPTAFYFAEAPVAPLQGFSSAMYDLSSVQVLKGPQGTLFGRNTTGGAILLTPAKPTSDFEGELTAKLGNYETRGLQGFVNIPVTPNLFVRLSGFYNEHGGYAKYISPQLFGQEAYAERILDGRLSVRWEPTDGIENNFVGSYFDLRTTTNPGIVVAVNPNSRLASTLPGIFDEIYVPGGTRGPREAYSDFPQNDDVWGYHMVNSTTARLSDSLTLKNIIAYRNVDVDQRITSIGSSLPAAVSSVSSAASNFSEELQLTGTFFDDRLVVTTGVFYSKLKAYSAAQTAALYVNRPFPAINLSSFVGDITNISKAAYAQGTFKITDKLSLTAGARITGDHRKVDYQSRNINSLFYIPTTTDPVCNVIDDAGNRLPPDACSLKVSKKYTEPTYTLSLEYHVTPDILVYATRRTGYRSGGFNQRAFTSGQRQPFNPEKQTDHEIGFKSTVHLADWRIQLNAAYYHDEIKDVQKNVQSFVGGTIFSSTFNAANAIVQGVDVDFQVNPTRDFMIGVNYAYIDTGYKSFPYLVGGIERDFSDRKFSGIPKNQLSVYANYGVDLPRDMGKVTLSGDWSHQDGHFISDVYQSKEQISIIYTPEQIALLPDGNRPYRTRGYDLFNARLNWDSIGGSAISAALFVRNITNAAPEIASNPSYEGLGNISLTIGPPRTYGMEVKVRF